MSGSVMIDYRRNGVKYNVIIEPEPCTVIELWPDFSRDVTIKKY